MAGFIVIVAAAYIGSEFVAAWVKGVALIASDIAGLGR